jgi:hypothetical protein
MYLPGDLILCHGGGLLQRGIRWAERSPGEAASWANHVAGFTSPGMVTEALYRVVCRPFADFAAQAADYQIWRCVGLTETQREAVAAVALGYVGREYGYFKILAHLGDALLSRLAGRNIFITRRLALMDRYPICSWVWAQAYQKALGLTFGVPASEADPDDMHDCIRTSAAWIMVAEHKGA